VLENSAGLDVFLTRQGTDVPLLLTVNDFISVVTELPRGELLAEATTLPNADVILVATLLTGGVSAGPSVTLTETALDEEVFLVFAPPPRSLAGNAGQGNTAAGDVPQDPAPAQGVKPVEPEGSGWESLQLGLDEHWRRQRERQQVFDALRKMLDAVQDALEQLRDLFGDPSGDPDQPGPPAVPPGDPPLEKEALPAPRIEDNAQGAEPHPQAEPIANASPGEEGGDVVARAETASVNATPQGPPPVGDDWPGPTPDLYPALLAAWFFRTSDPGTKEPRRPARNAFLTSCRCTRGNGAL
jgi:hypothetical protein